MGWNHPSVNQPLVVLYYVYNGRGMCLCVIFHFHYFLSTRAYIRAIYKGSSNPISHSPGSSLFAFYIKSSTDVINAPFTSSFWLILRKVNPIYVLLYTRRAISSRATRIYMGNATCVKYYSFVNYCIHERVIHRDEKVQVRRA